MKLISSSKTDVNTTELLAQIDAESFENAVERTYQRQKKNISMPGFRKGKVPRKLCENAFGQNVFYEDAINLVLNEEMAALVAEAALELVDTPRVEVSTVSKEEGASLKIVCVTMPAIHLEHDAYTGLEAVRNERVITDADIDSQLETLRKRNARMISADDRAAQMGDDVTLDFEGFFGDEPFEGGKGENYDLTLGSNQFIPGFEEQIVGHKIDEPFDITVTFPENYPNTEYAGKEARFHCLLHSINVEELPALDDDFAKDASQFDTLEEFKQDIRKNLEESAKTAADRGFESALADQLIALVQDPIPHVMFERRANSLVEQFAGQLKEQGLSLEDYLQYTSMDRDALKETYLERAQNEVTLRLALQHIGKQENLEVTEEEINDEVAKMAERYKMDSESVRRVIGDDVRTDLLVTKAMAYVKEHATALDAPPEEPAAEAEEPKGEAAEPSTEEAPADKTPEPESSPAE